MGDYHSPYYDTLRGDESEMEFNPPNKPVARETQTRQETETWSAAAKVKAMPDGLFRRALERCGLPMPNEPLAEKKFLRDSVFPEISRLLEESGKRQWSLSPRTFSILFVLNITEAMDYFVSQGRTDRFLPYSEANLPDCVPGGLRSRFIKLQNMVRCRREDVSELEESGKHIYLPGNADAYFYSSEILGRGRFAVVDRVRSWRTAQTYARKQIRRGESVLDDKTQLAAFEREMASLKTLSHRHVVRLVGSYTDPAHLGLIMTPVADVDLHDHLRRCEAKPDGRTAMLRNFFGCLATALAYVHAKKIRHKDIKPKNILVKGDQVFLADFGTSRICLDGNLTTNGVSKEGTSRYWAPEVGDNANRNRSSDVWSLGCVFLEMATTLFGRTQLDMHRFYASNGSENYQRLSLNSVATTFVTNVPLRMACETTATLETKDRKDHKDPSELNSGTIKTSEVFIVPPQGLSNAQTTTNGSPPRKPMQKKPRVRSAAAEPQPEPADKHLGDSSAETESIDTVRFSGLPSDCRPEPTNHGADILNEDEGADGITEDSEFTSPEPVRPPPFHHRDCLPLPRASLVPSYVLAGTNRFARDELQDPSLPGSAKTNVFLCGRLMFPSVVHAVAARSTAGAYSPDLQRRVLPSSDDWSHANLSIQRASEIMTPAKLRGYDRWRPRGLQCAVLQKSAYTDDILKKPRLRNSTPLHSPPPPGEVVGFLLVGVRKEVVRYLDLLFVRNERDLAEMTPRPKEEESGHDDPASPLRRETVHVDVELVTGEVTQVEAHTYVWKHRTSDLGQLWDEGHFLRGSHFQRLLVGHEMKRAEQALAGRMGISFVLVGDYLCGAVVAQDAAELERLLGRGWDPDAPCRYYGNVLHAAVVTGNEDMVGLLLDHGADVDRKDGRYGSALVAAAFGSRKAITRRLLRHGADVFASHPVHGDALYQAVGQSDYAVAEMLLEHAAWLTEDWGEICDVANEAGDREIQSLLRQTPPPGDGGGGGGGGGGPRELEPQQQQQQPSYTRILGAVVQKGIAVQAMSGNWKGRKGVAVTVAALNAGASTSILPLMRSAVGPFRALVEELRRVDRDQEHARQMDLEQASRGTPLGNEVEEEM
ncbi:putative 3-phosphoinositide-dependent protein kinase 2 [Colletotrichum tanaceti]|uniref:Putative 3-phosphoinositide-dependent protein kinase 2 n=1 Tax=Colletotrichum tanaceti TaxID=1306861 RepID=A0A4U6XIL3_9PEZI|nr:putative 3-phosphoinositide-dependent protein kinase 2 [Colletotrichum tanaceti]